MMGSFGRILRPIFDPGLAVAPPWWQVAGKTCVAAYQPKGAASLAASYINLANPGTYDAVPNVAPTWDASNGWKAEVVTQWLNTGITAAGGWSMLARFSGAAGSLTGICGDATNTSNRFALVTQVSNWIWYLYGANFRITTPWLAAGVVGVAGGQGYRNGVPDGAAMAAWAGSTAATVTMLNVRGWDTFDGYIQAVAIYNTTLTAGEVAVVSAAMAAL